MKYSSYEIEDLGVKVALAECGGDAHAMLHVEPDDEDFAGQWQRIQAAERVVEALTKCSIRMRRYFLSDAANQVGAMGKLENCSCIQQQPLDGSKIATWLWLSSNEHGEIWTNGLVSDSGDSATQSVSVLEQYQSELAKRGATVEENCVRTWFFVRDVDTQYGGLVSARKNWFAEHGLTEGTHYIASTGIGGTPAGTKNIVQLGGYAIVPKPEVKYLYGRTHLNATSEYGVTFERGAYVDFTTQGAEAESGLRKVFISGTASINNKGEVVHVGNIVKQTERMLENVEVLLNEAETSWENVAQMIVYLRDTADYKTVETLLEDKKYDSIPKVIVLAPVCRPSWLIEVECLAIKEL